MLGAAEPPTVFVLEPADSINSVAVGGIGPINFMPHQSDAPAVRQAVALARTARSERQPTQAVPSRAKSPRRLATAALGCTSVAAFVAFATPGGAAIVLAQRSVSTAAALALTSFPCVARARMPSIGALQALL